MNDKIVFVPCQIKFAFDVLNNHALNFYDFFGFEDIFDMVRFHANTYFEKTDSVFFSEVDLTGAKLTVIFETNCSPSEFQAVYDLAQLFLKHIDEKPKHNDCPEFYNHCLSSLADQHIIIYDNEPDEKVFSEFNRVFHGASNFKDLISG